MRSRKLREALKKVEISRKIITGDAMHTQKAISTQIIDQGGDYVFPVKENQLRLYQNIQQLFARRISETRLWKNSNGFSHYTKSE